MRVQHQTPPPSPQMAEELLSFNASRICKTTFYSQTSLWSRGLKENKSRKKQELQIWLSIGKNLRLVGFNWLPSSTWQSGARWHALGNCPARQVSKGDLLSANIRERISVSHAKYIPLGGVTGHSVQAEQKHLKHFAAKLESHWSRKDCCKASTVHSVSMATLHSLPVLKDLLPIYSS